MAEAASALATELLRALAREEDRRRGPGGLGRAGGLHSVGLWVAAR